MTMRYFNHFATLLLFVSSPSLATSFEVDPTHTRIAVKVNHAGFSNAIGTVSGSTGKLVVGSKESPWQNASVDVVIPLRNLDFGDAHWNEAVAGKRLLNTDKHPQARFISSKIEPIDASTAIVHGSLMLHGMSRPVELNAKLNAYKRHPLPPFRRTVGFSATTHIKRSDFGITSWRSVIGDDVIIDIELEATYTTDSSERSSADETLQPNDEKISNHPDETIR